MSTLILIPSMDTVPIQFAQSLAMLNKTDDCAVAIKTGSLVYIARNELAKLSIKMGADYVLWLDSDMTFEPDTLTRLIQTMEEEQAPIVSGIYYRRVPPYHPVAFLKLDLSGDRAITEELTDIPDKPFKVAGVGFGCVLMRTDVLVSVMAKFGDPFFPLPNAGEDIAFCWRAKQCGYDVVIDPRVECGHVGHYVVTRDLYEACNGQGGRK